MSNAEPIPVVGIGADGLDGLTPAARRALENATAIHGSPRQLALVAALRRPMHPWPSPLLPALPGLLDGMSERGEAIVASGDPMFHGIGATLARILGPDRLRVFPAPSSASLAAARLGWPLAEVEVHSCVSDDPHIILSHTYEGSRMLVLSRDRSTPVALSKVLTQAGYGASRITVLAELGADSESRHDSSAEVLAKVEPSWPDLCLSAIEVHCTPGARTVPGTSCPGLPDACYASDGQLTKRVVRSVTISALAPVPGEVLWDVGGGSGSVGIEWMRSAPRARAVAFERDPARSETIRSNAVALGVPGLVVVTGAAPESFRDFEDSPDAVFIGGGVTAPGMLEACWSRLRPGGRLVAAAVTLESEAELVQWRHSHGGELTRLGVETAGSLGSFTGWSPSRPVVHLACIKPLEEDQR